jgi:4-hydroxy-tetrahydrodipicolinate synthase
MQTAADLRMREYTDLALRGDVKRARAIRDSLEPVRQALRSTRPPEKPNAHAKYWQDLLGQAGGPVRRPLLALTETEKATAAAALRSCGLKLADTASSAA